MNTDGDQLIRPDTRFYAANRAKYFPSEALAAYAGQEVAFSADGTRIVGHGRNFDQLWDELEAVGINPRELVFSYVPPADEGQDS